MYVLFSLKTFIRKTINDFRPRGWEKFACGISSKNSFIICSIFPQHLSAFSSSIWFSTTHPYTKRFGKILKISNSLSQAYSRNAFKCSINIQIFLTQLWLNYWRSIILMGAIITYVLTLPELPSVWAEIIPIIQIV